MIGLEWTCHNFSRIDYGRTRFGSTEQALSYRLYPSTNSQDAHTTSAFRAPSSIPVFFTEDVSTAICVTEGCDAGGDSEEEHDYFVRLSSVIPAASTDSRARYYGISAGIATVALAYASVPMYKMVELNHFLDATP